MKLKTSLQVSAVFPVALAVIVVLSIIIRSRSLAETRQALEISEAALPMISEVNTCLYRYAANPDAVSRTQCLAVIRQLKDYCDAQSARGGVLGFLISEVGESAARLDAFSRESAPDNSELAKQMAELFSRGLRVLSVSRQNAEAEEQASETAFLVFIAVFAMMMTGSVFSASSRIMKRLNIMKDACDRLRQGDTSRRIDASASDELGEVGRSLNALVNMYESKVGKLESELGQHRKGEETRDTATAAAREGNIRLADALTKLKRAQLEIVQQERVRAFEQVVMGVARDFNEVLAPILTMSDYLLDSPGKLDGRDDLREDIRVINASARKTLRKVRVMTDLFQSFEEPAPQKLRLEDIVLKAEDLVEKGSRHHVSAYKIEKDFEEVPFVVGNAVDYMEAIHNLMENAFEAMDPGSTMRMTIRQKGSTVVLSVRDDGVGMTEEVYKRALEPFFSTKGKGHSGMGLPFVVVAVGKYGGSLDISSTEGHGTTVSLTIPVYDPKVHTKKENSAGKPSGKLKILVIDDEEWTRVVLARSLTVEGHDVVAAAGGAEGLEKFRAGSFDIVILDRAMPDMTGDEVAAALEREKGGAAVIMLTGFGDIMIDRGEQVRGVDLVLSKPFTLSDLRAGIGKVLDLKRK